MNMRRIFLLLLTLLFAVALTSCDRPTEDDCRTACDKAKKFAREDFNSAAPDLPEDIRTQEWVRNKRFYDELVGACTATCVQAGDKVVAACLSEAGSAHDWQSCLAPKAR